MMALDSRNNKNFAALEISYSFDARLRQQLWKTLEQLRKAYRRLPLTCWSWGMQAESRRDAPRSRHGHCHTPVILLSYRDYITSGLDGSLSNRKPKMIDAIFCGSDSGGLSVLAVKCGSCFPSENGGCSISMLWFVNQTYRNPISIVAWLDYDI